MTNKIPEKDIVSALIKQGKDNLWNKWSHIIITDIFIFDNTNFDFFKFIKYMKDYKYNEKLYRISNSITLKVNNKFYMILNLRRNLINFVLRCEHQEECLQLLEDCCPSISKIIHNILDKSSAKITVPK